MTDVQTDTKIVAKFRDGSFKTVRSAAIEVSVSKRAVVRRLTSTGVKACRPAVYTAYDNSSVQTQSVIWAQEHDCDVRWTIDQFASVRFSLAMRQHSRLVQQVTTLDDIENLKNVMNQTLF